jgi:hypothetical protein
MTYIIIIYNKICLNEFYKYKHFEIWMDTTHTFDDGMLIYFTKIIVNDRFCTFVLLFVMYDCVRIILYVYSFYFIFVSCTVHSFTRLSVLKYTRYHVGVRLMVFNATLNNISAVVRYHVGLNRTAII